MPYHGPSRAPGPGRCEVSATAAIPVLILGAIEIWAAVPAGVALGLPYVVVWILSATGSLASVALVSNAGDAARAWLVRRFGHGGLAPRGRLWSIWVRWGVPGWGLVSPLVFAPPMGTALALALGAPRKRLWLWMSAGVLVWTTILVVAVALGVSVIGGRS